jgi:hypothetical protein
MNPYQSPAIIGDNNKLTMHLGKSLPRIRKEDEFVQALRSVGPSTVVIDCYEDKDSLPLCADLYNLFIDANWTILSTPTAVGESWVGVRVVVKDEKAPPPGATALVAQLKLNGITAGLVENPNDSDLAIAMFSVRVGYLYNEK